MDQDSNQEPNKRLRNLLSDHEGETGAQPEPQDQPQSQTRPPLFQLPKRKTQVQEDQPSQSSSEAIESRNLKKASPVTPSPLPDADSRIPQETTQAPPPEPPPASPFADLKFGPPFWTVTGILSLVVNIVLIAVLLILYNRVDQLRALQGTASNIGASVLGGMYTNFEKMDQAAIKTVIPVDAQIPLDLTVPVKTTTQIILAEAVPIPNTHVLINTGGVSINAPARVTLPAGTPLMVELNFDLPVTAEIPVHLEVPVDIPMAETELHEPFVGLQDVVRPWYCLVEPRAFSLTGQAICR